MPDGQATGAAPASPVPYRAYVSHRRAQSSLSLASSAATTPAPSPPPTLARAPPNSAASAAPAPAPAARSKQAQSSRAPTSALAAAPLVAPPALRPSPLRADKLPPPPALRTGSSLRGAAAPPAAAQVARGADERPPPALRTASSLRAAAPASAAKGKARASQEQPAAPDADAAAATSDASPSQTGRPPVQRSASGRALGTAASGAPPPLTPGPSEAASSEQTPSLTAEASSSSKLLPGHGQSARPGHAHSHSHSHSTVHAAPSHASHPSHARSLSSTPLPHHISTAARLRGAGGHSGASSPLPVSPLLSPALAPTLSAQQAAQPQLPALQPGPSAASRQPGFQPRGVSRSRTDEFLAARESKGKGREERGLEGERMQRRLEKLVAIHFSGDAPAPDAPSTSTFAAWTGSWRGARAEEEKRTREREREIVRWEEDGERRSCAVCSTPFSLAVRKHHCRLCGRVVCASPHLAALNGFGAPGAPSPAQPISAQKCSRLVVADPASALMRDAPRTDPSRPERVGVRVCRDCRSIVMRRQYMMDDGHVPALVKLYDALSSLQREIETNLPEFQEMIMGLQKQDASAALGTDVDTAPSRAALQLQREAAQARKALLTNFANYDALAKRIRRLPVEDAEGGADEDGGAAPREGAQERLQEAIWTRANLFLQQNMFPLQSLPKLGAQKGKSKTNGTHSPTPSTSSLASLTPEELSLLGPNAEEELEALQEQLAQLEAWAAKAQQARKLDDAKTLRASAEEVAREVRRRQTVLRGAGRLK
ncbi:FYVE-domain-containing protein [Tilletiopsis washingtonensis]|uniref:FYVE-domain-containing protein n=1 Tax=Tilletiopsis washingtonensis TaxID=58919 RepID=A0A316ZAT7_9BASI|nr:FYVE-domain-containing protein [Tilletiopsis washingtonensis]PWN98937.1 FYVE-domain-containing protein [Tilletiopsis washingtonensis]